MRVVRTIVAVVAIVFAVSWLGYSFWRAYQPKPEQLQGQIEAQEYYISSKIAGRIDRVLVKKGDRVTRGQLVFTMLSPEIDARMTQAVAGQEAAEALADEARNGTREQQIAAARETWQQAQTAVDLLEKTYARIDALFTEGVVAEQKRDEVFSQLAAARHAAGAAHQMYLLAREGARPEDIRAAEGKVKVAAGAVAEVQAYATDTTIASWHDGEVTQLLLHGGELAAQGFPVVTIMDTDDVWAVFHVREDRLQHFAKGTEFECTIPAMGSSPYRFRVSHVAVMGDFATWRATRSDRGFDMRTFEIEARPVKPVAGLRAGMSVLTTLP
jgi:HlyD family secretion protein